MPPKRHVKGCHYSWCNVADCRERFAAEFSCTCRDIKDRRKRKRATAAMKALREAKVYPRTTEELLASCQADAGAKRAGIDVAPWITPTPEAFADMAARIVELERKLAAL